MCPGVAAKWSQMDGDLPASLTAPSICIAGPPVRFWPYQSGTAVLSLQQQFSREFAQHQIESEAVLWTTLFCTATLTLYERTGHLGHLHRRYYRSFIVMHGFYPLTKNLLE